MLVTGRAVMTAQLALIREHEPALLREADATAIHETRKAIRRLRTALKVWSPYYPAATLVPYNRCLKKTMQLLAQARDLHVLAEKLAGYSQTVEREEAASLRALTGYWQEKEQEAARMAQEAIRDPQHSRCLDSFQSFLDAGVPELATGPHSAQRVHDLAPGHVYEQLAAVRAFDTAIPQATLATLHELRIRFKEFRYTLEFFAPLLAPEITPLLEELDRIQDHLGDLNDTRVALDLLGQTPDAQHHAAVLYQEVQEAEARRLQTTFAPLWESFYGSGWRDRLAAALVIL